MVTPLNLIEIAGLIPSNPGLMINNPYQMLWINKIGLQLQIFRINNLSWNSEALPELGYMEDIVDRR